MVTVRLEIRERKHEIDSGNERYAARARSAPDRVAKAPLPDVFMLPGGAITGSVHLTYIPHGTLSKHHEYHHIYLSYCTILCWLCNQPLSPNPPDTTCYCVLI